MPETFLGDLAEVKLFDILKPLFVDKRTGKILSGEKRVENCIWSLEILPMPKPIILSENSPSPR